MKKLRMNLLILLCAVAVLALPMQTYAADDTHIARVYTYDMHGNAAAWLGKIKPVIDRIKVLYPQHNVHIHVNQFAGTDVSKINMVVEYPSMANMEQVVTKVNKDEEARKLFASAANLEVEMISQSLLFDRAHDQVRLSSSPVEEVYTIDTHGKNDAYVEGSKKLHEVIYQKIPDISVRIWEARFAGKSTGMIYIIVGYPSMTDMERIGKIIDDDKEIQKLFAKRDKIGATTVSCSLSLDVTP